MRLAVTAAAEVALAVVATAASGLVYRGFFATLEFLPILGLACLFGAVTAAVTAARRMRLWSTALVAVTGLALVAGYGVFGDSVQNGLPTARTGSAVLQGIVNGWDRMLTVAVPADVWGELLMTPVLVTWAAAFLAVTLTLRTRVTLAPLAPPLLAFAFALLVIGSRPGAHAIATIVFLLAALALIAIRAQRTATSATGVSQPQSRLLLTSSLMVAAGALIGIAGGQILPLASGRERFDPRTLHPPPIAINDTLTPLARLKPQLSEDPPRTLFTVGMDGEDATRVDRVRTAALDVFDGITWTSSDTYQVAGSHLAVDPVLTRSQRVSASIDVKDLAGPYLPVLGWPSRLAPAEQANGEFGFNAASGMVVSTAPAVRGMRYEAAGEISNRDAGLASALPSATPELAPLPDIPAPLRNLARQITADQPTPFAKLTALESHLRSLILDQGGPPGHSYAAITRLLEQQEPGYAEQNASAFTVLARALGYPARVAVGYRLRNYSEGTFTVTTADANAWSEVHFAGYGWVTFDPTSTMTTGLPIPPPDIPVVEPEQQAPAPGAPPPADSDAPASAATGFQAGFDWTDVLRGALLVVIIAAALVLIVAGGIAAAKRRRRGRRRRAQDHAAQVLGAWHEIIDRLIERGIAPPVSSTAHEVAEHATAALGSAAHSIAATAPLAATAVFAPGQVDHRAAEQAWHLVDKLQTELYPRRMHTTRLRAAVDPRPLWTPWRTARQRRRGSERLELGRYG